jgi:hypothetical protein
MSPLEVASDAGAGIPASTSPEPAGEEVGEAEGLTCDWFGAGDGVRAAPVS